MQNKFVNPLSPNYQLVYFSEVRNDAAKDTIQDCREGGLVSNPLLLVLVLLRSVDPMPNGGFASSTSLTSHFWFELILGEKTFLTDCSHASVMHEKQERKMFNAR